MYIKCRDHFTSVCSAKVLSSLWPIPLSLSSYANEGLINFLSKDLDLLQAHWGYSSLHTQKVNGVITFYTIHECSHKHTRWRCLWTFGALYNQMHYIYTAQIGLEEKKQMKDEKDGVVWRVKRELLCVKAWPNAPSHAHTHIWKEDTISLCVVSKCVWVCAFVHALAGMAVPPRSR